MEYLFLLEETSEIDLLHLGRALTIGAVASVLEDVRSKASHELKECIIKFLLIIHLRKQVFRN